MRVTAVALACTLAFSPFVAQVARADGEPASSAAPAASASSAPPSASSAPPAASSPTPASLPPKPPKIADPTGTPVRITSTNVDTDIFLVRGDAPEHPLGDPFERIGTAPLMIRLAPGVYTIQSSNPTSSLGHARFHVEQGHAIDIVIRNGDAGLRTVGGVFIGLGVTAVLLGVLAMVAISPHDDNYNRFGIGIPLFLGGLGVGGVGLGMTFAGSTSIKIPTSSLQARTVGVTLSF